MNASSDPFASGPSLPVPMPFGQILDRIYRLMRLHYRLFFSIAAVPVVPALAVVIAVVGFSITVFTQLATKTVPGSAVSYSPAFALEHFPWAIFCIYPVMFAAYALYFPAAIFATTRADRGEVVGMRRAYSVALSRFGRSLWLMVLCALYLVVPVAVLGALVATGTLLVHHASNAGSGTAAAFFLIPLLILLYLGILIYSILIMLRFSVAFPASIEEDLPAWKAMQRSVILTRGARGRIFLVLLVVYAVAYAVELAGIFILFALAAVVALIAMSAHVVVGSPVFVILIGLGVLAYGLVVAAYMVLCYSSLVSALAVLYHDQRLRTDGPPLSTTT